MTRRVLLAVAVLSFMGGGQVEAQSTKWFSSICRVGALKACASVRIQTTDLGPGNGTAVTVWIQNRQGAGFPGTLDNTGGSRITRFGIIQPSVGTVNSALTINTLGGATNNGVLATDWGFASTTGIGGYVEVELKAGGPGGPPNNSLAGAIEGCDPANAVSNRKYITCGNSQFVSFSFSTTAQWDASQAEIALFFDGIVNTTPSGGERECRTEDPNSSIYCEPTAVPEPVTMLLLGTGLAGVGGAGMRRRLRRNGDVVNA